MHVSQSLKQAGNDEIPVSAGKTGVYKLDFAGVLENYKLQSVFESVPVAPINIQKGYIYDYVYKL
ncbi:MAG: hypothetical protein LBD20_05255 [Spirochaetaceae bacterium]|jgi:hypothetical protein|nr:hypothetical protein [Spirochaetaceae bacterium]